MARHLSLALLLLLLSSSPVQAQPQSLIQPQPQAQPAESPSLSLTIHCSQPSFKSGGEIPITFEITNTGDKPYTYWDRNRDRSGRMDEFKLTATGLDGKPIPNPRAEFRGAFFGGGPAIQGTLQPGKSFTKTIALNRWALITAPGKYTVTATYSSLPARSKSITSPPIQILITPRTDQEMAAYINSLAEKLKPLLTAQNLPSLQPIDDLLQKLMFTRDSRIIPTLIDAMYTTRGNASFWVTEAFNYYLPKNDQITSALSAAAEKRGLANGMLPLLQSAGLTETQLKKLIAFSLSPDHPASHAEAALAAQQFSDDAFTSRLIAIANDKQSPARDQAIFALAFNRTDESVATLKQLLQEPDLAQHYGSTTAKTTRMAIRTAYNYRGHSQGRKLRPDDFDKSFQDPQTPIDQ